MSGTETGMHQFHGRHSLENGLAPTSTKDKQNISVLIRKLIGHASSPPWCILHTGVVWRLQGSAAYAVSREGCQTHGALGLRQMAKDQVR